MLFTFKSQENLIASLELKPTNKNLIRINDSVDESVLRHLLKKGEYVAHIITHTTKRGSKCPKKVCKSMNESDDLAHTHF